MALTPETPTNVRKEIERQIRQKKADDDKKIQEQVRQWSNERVFDGIIPAESIPYVDESQRAYQFMRRLFEMQPLLPEKPKEENYRPRFEWDLRYGDRTLPPNLPATSLSQPLSLPTSGVAAGTWMPGNPRPETPLARALRQFAERPDEESDRAATPSANRSPVRFEDPLAALAALVRLSAMRDGPG